MNKGWKKKFVPYIPLMPHILKPSYKVLDRKCAENSTPTQSFVESRAKRLHIAALSPKQHNPLSRNKDNNWLSRLGKLRNLARKKQNSSKPIIVRKAPPAARTTFNSSAMIALNPFNSRLFASHHSANGVPRVPQSVAYNTVSSVDIPRDFELKFYTNPLMFKVISVIKAAEVKELKPFNGVTFAFSVKLSYLRTIDENLTITNGTRFAIILRIAPYSPNQFHFVDMVPNSMRITINGRPVSVENFDPLTSSVQELEYIDAPLELTNYCYPNNQIRLMSQAKHNLRVVVGVYLVQLIGVEESLNTFNINPMCREINAEHSTVQRIIAANGGKILLTLMCPLSNQRMEIPCVGDCCDHVECFDLSSFLKSKKDPFRWKCPICNLVMKFIAKDVMFSNVLQNVSSTCNEIVFYGSGEWREIVKSQIEDIIIVDLTEDNSVDSFEQSSIIEDIFIERA